MQKDDPPNSLIAFAPRAKDFEKRIRTLAAVTKNVRWSQHALDRMAERDITIRVALNVLREGMVVGNVEPGKGVGEWKAKIVHNVKGRRDVGVIAVLVKSNRINVSTVEWEDLK
ncbi:DUF4258 domain-containing protein [Mesorhizobium sp. BH1-1-5]|uniref:DUF4258 domain-containing protein n=1 Tax=Mesorhizobium sp. BH1-1-5 TaxID=2876661 RepID=UPI001CCF1C22|nr:DUF4258 domain-containing protein [Mesorhizobium sp. BH1-1-5]MBZ9985715.1 DUF4258 domain-containing protein [Mesorhizobium sp. BH1-1-5]